MSESKKFQRFGKYLILDHLVDGGMAKICRARYLGEQANKVVAIKMVQPQFSKDEAFVRMFQDELNITFGMLHPNIMQVYDYGETSGQLYTAMEYIHGANLKQYMDRLKEKKVVFPVEISCYIISQVCIGLHYAHTFTDKLTGKPYKIVHRDISPHNIMLTYDGAVKVIDFGIAKANTNSEATQAGTIKGKLSYLAPEYLDGMELDARYDEFAVGITLWELLCSRKLFQGNDLSVLKQVQACKITPPSEINPNVPKELDAIVMKALSKDRTHRYENLDQMNRALVRFLYAQYPEFNASDLNNFAEELFKKEIESDREKFVEYGKIDVQAYIEQMKKDDTRSGRVVKQVKSTEGRERVRELELAVDSSQVGIEIETNPNDTRKLNRTAISPAKTLAKNIKPAPGSTPAPHGAGHSKKHDKTSSRVLSKKQIEQAEEAESKRSMIIFIIAASVVGFAYFQAELFESMFSINLKKMIHGEEEVARTISSVPGKKDSAHATAQNKPVVKTTGKIVFSGVDFEMEVYIDGHKVDYVGSPIPVELGKEIIVAVKKSGHKSYTSKVTLTKEQDSSVINVPELEKSKTGFLTISQNYAAGSKIIYEEGGETIERDLPLQDQQINEGTYQAKIVNPILGTEKKVEFIIEENKKHFLE